MNNLAALNMLNVGFMQFVMEVEQEYNEMVEQERRRRSRTCWARNWLKPERRLAVGHYHQLMEKLRLDDQESFYNFLRITSPFLPGCMVIARIMANLVRTTGSVERN